MNRITVKIEPMGSENDESSRESVKHVKVERAQRQDVIRNPVSVKIESVENNAEEYLSTRPEKNCKEDNDASALQVNIMTVEDTDVNIEYDPPSADSFAPHNNIEEDKLNTYQCSTCGKAFNWKSSLITHFLVHTRKVEEKRADANIAYEPQYFTESNQMINSTHDIMKSNLEKPYKCSVCFKGFAEGGNLTKHLRVHTGEQPYHCSVCDRRFTFRSDFKRHTKIHTGEKPHKCSICYKKFINKSDLTKHVRIHTGEEPYKCLVCLKEFTEVGNLTKHMRIHTGEKPYECSVCNKLFTYGSNFTRHMRIHTGEKPHGCTVCVKHFTNKGDLKKHMKIHTGGETYKCSVCSKEFTENGNLTKHMRIHTGEKPYKCSMCTKKYINKVDLNKHLAKIHQEEEKSKTIPEKKLLESKNKIIT